MGSAVHDPTRASRWRRARACAPANQCVEVLLATEDVAVRDTKPDIGPELHFYRASWASFLIYCHTIG